LVKTFQFITIHNYVIRNCHILKDKEQEDLKLQKEGSNMLCSQVSLTI